jgi:hypothetical protein
MPVSTATGAPTVWVELDGVRRQSILDSGSSMSLIQPGISQAEITTIQMAPVGITGDELPMTGAQVIEFSMGGEALHHSFGVCALQTVSWGLISWWHTKHS